MSAARFLCCSLALLMTAAAAPPEDKAPPEEKTTPPSSTSHAHGAKSADDRAPQAGGPKQPPGHQRMVALLADLHRKGLETNPFLGHGQHHALAARLAALPANAPPMVRWRILAEIAGQALNLGETEAAIGHFEAAQAVLKNLGEKAPRPAVVTTLYELGVAHMRHGELLNCAADHNSERCILPIRGAGVHTIRTPSEQAMGYFLQILAHPAADERQRLAARWLLNIAAMTLGRYPDGVPAPHRIPADTFAAQASFPRFVDIAPNLGLDSFDIAGGAIADDFDGDHRLDIVASTNDSGGQLRFYRNGGDGTFSERTIEAGLVGITGGLNLVQADYDNDGHTDILVLRGGWWRQHGRHPNSLLRNRGDGTFTDMTFAAGLGATHLPGQTAGWADYDNDGDLDLYIGVETEQAMPFSSQLFRNNGDGTFTDVAPTAGVTNDRYAKGVTWGDYDGDRDPDLYVSNYASPNRLYRNEGDGTFTDVAQQAGVAFPMASFPTWFWDFDNDGALDLFVAAYASNMNLAVANVAASYLGLGRNDEMDRLYRGDGRGGFRDVARAQGLPQITMPMGSNFGDLDNDGFPDIYLGTGYPPFEGLMPNVMLHNRGGTGFTDVTIAGGFGHLQKGHGVAFADLDDDGDQDIFEQMGGAVPGDAFGNVLYENPGFGNQWLKVKLVGVASNRSAIGARLRLEIVDAGTRRTLYRHVSSGGSFGCNPLRQEIGLGKATRVARLEVFWPTTGKKSTYSDIAAGQLIEIREDAAIYRAVPLAPLRFAS